MARFFHLPRGVPFRRLVRWVALATLVLVPAGMARVAPLAWPADSAPAEGSCPDSGSCPRCPASSRRAPDDCRTCVRSVEGVATRRAGPRMVRRATQVAADPARRESPGAAPAETRAARARHSVLGASPPRHLLLATLRN